MDITKIVDLPFKVGVIYVRKVSKRFLWIEFESELIKINKPKGFKPKKIGKLMAVVVCVKDKPRNSTYIDASEFSLFEIGEDFKKGKETYTPILKDKEWQLLNK